MILIYGLLYIQCGVSW